MSSMPHIRRVYDSLHEIIADLGKLHDLVLQERQDIIDLNLAGLSERQLAIEKLLSQVSELNKTITLQIGFACDAVGVIGEKTLSQLITAVPKPDRDMYVRLQKSVRADSAAVENELAINKALLQDSLAFTNYSLQTFTGILKSTGAATYGQKGRFVETIDQPRIICKEI